MVNKAKWMLLDKRIFYVNSSIIWKILNQMAIIKGMKERREKKSKGGEGRKDKGSEKEEKEWGKEEEGRKRK